MELTSKVCCDLCLGYSGIFTTVYGITMFDQSSDDLTTNLLRYGSAALAIVFAFGSRTYNQQLQIEKEQNIQDIVDSIGSEINRKPASFKYDFS